MHMIEKKFEEIFLSVPGALCVRDYYVVKGNDKIPIRVVIYPPFMSELTPVCRYTADGAGLSVDALMGGADRLGAILHTFFAIRAILESLPYDVFWIGQPRMLDLPLNMNPGFGQHFERHCEELVRAEHLDAAANLAETKRLWGEGRNERYEDCPGYLESLVD